MDEIKGYEKEWLKKHPKPQDTEDRMLTLKAFNEIVDGKMEEQQQALEPEKPKRKRIYLKVFMDPATKEAIKTKAKEQARLSASAYLLQCGLGKTVKPPLPTQIVKDVNGWSRNLNQLSYICNSTRCIDPKRIEEIKELAEQIIKLLRKEK